VRVDMHSHTMWSGDSTTTPDELVAAVSATGVDVLAVTDHNAIEGAEELAAVLACRVIIGEEVRTQMGEIIGLFLSERIPSGLSPAEVARRIRAQGGVVYIPHPFDPMRARLQRAALDGLVAEGLVDAIEGRNAKTSLEHLNQEAVDYATGHGLAIGAGSDAHVPDALGAAYVTMGDFDDAGSFVAQLASAQIIGHHADPPRPWSPRVVPSTT
jgi:predicted metal-dependent phosphoesterase TrpH